MSFLNLNFMLFHGLLFSFVYSASISPFIVFGSEDKLAKDDKENLPKEHTNWKIGNPNSSLSTTENFKMPTNSPEVSAEPPQEVMFYEEKSKFQHEIVPRSLYDYPMEKWSRFTDAPFSANFGRNWEYGNEKVMRRPTHISSLSNKLSTLPIAKLDTKLPDSNSKPEPNIKSDVNSKLFLFDRGNFNDQSSDSKSPKKDDFGRKIFLFR